MASEDILAQMARDVGKLQNRVHMLESITRPQAREKLAAIFKKDLSVAVVLCLSKGGTQTEQARLVSKSIGRTVGQKTISTEMIRLKGLGILGRIPAGSYYIEDSWKEMRLDAWLRTKAKGLGVKVAPQRRKATR